MFLWVDLLIEYLQCDGLSMGERQEALDKMVSLEDLQSLYNAILIKVSRKPPKARDNIRRAFQWTGIALRPLDSNGPGTAIAFLPGESKREFGGIPNLGQTLGSFSGALLEISQGGKVRVAYTSVKEYLQAVATRSDTVSLK